MVSGTSFPPSAIERTDAKLSYIFLDINWEIINVTKKGWEIAKSNECNILFKRFPIMNAQVYPRRNYPKDILERFMKLTNVYEDEDNRLLAVVYIISLFLLEGITEFTKAYLQVKDNPWPYVNLAKLVQNAKIGEGEVVELLKIANRHLPRIQLEHDRLKEEKNSLEAELSSKKAELNNAARTYQQFVDRNIELKKREDELQRNIDDMENKKAELQKTTTELENNTCHDNFNPEVKHDGLSLSGEGSRKILDTAELFHANQL